MQSQQELHLCCAAAPPCPTAALALKELLRSPLLLLPPLVSSFRRACVSRFCTAPAEHVRLLPLSSRLMSSTTSHAGTETFQRYHTKSAAAHQEDGIGSRHRVSEQEQRASSAWDICIWTHTYVEARWKILWHFMLPPSVRVKQRSFAVSSLNRTGGLTPGFIPAHLTGMSTRPVPCRASPVPPPPPPPRQVETSSKA